MKFMRDMKEGSRVRTTRVNICFKSRTNPKRVRFPHEGILLSHLDPRAWRVQLKRCKEPFPWTNAYGSDISWGRSIPENEADIRHAYNRLTLLGDLDTRKELPVLWDFGKVYWEPRHHLRPV